MQNYVQTDQKPSKITSNASENLIPRQSAATVLKASVLLWFLIVVTGQWIFAYYILDFYGGTAAQGDLEAWNKRLFRGIIESDHIGNILVGIHLLTAFIIAFCGPLQFIPQIRNRFPAFHRFNGRLYLATAFIISTAGLYLVCARGGVSATGDVSLGLNGLLIIIFAAMTQRFAIARKYDVHCRWALRLFLAVCAFLFGRAGFQAWIFLTDGMGHTNAYTGPFDVFWGFGMYLLPLTLLEFYLHVKEKGRSSSKIAMACLITVASALLGLGTFMVAVNMWIPNL